ncbi:hypothetical protein [Brunnivagina elsteri]|nr:hypothetical protein [Calothrix elsteri]
MVGLISLVSLQVSSAQAESVYVAKQQKTEKNSPYFSGKHVNKTSNKNELTHFYDKKVRQISRTSENAAKAQQMNDDYIKSGKRAAEVIPKDLGTGSRQKNPVDMLKRAGEELGNDIPKRVVGNNNNYDRSPIERELVQNKAARGDYGS